MKVITPPNPIPYKDNKRMIFLAGSIEMGKAENWQNKLISEFRDEFIDVLILNPRRNDWDSSWKQDYDNPQFYQQVQWELDCLDNADEIVMYFSPGTKSPITLLELGLYANSKKITVICPDEFWRKGNVEIICQNYQIPLYNNLNEFITKFVEKQIKIERV